MFASGASRRCFLLIVFLLCAIMSRSGVQGGANLCSVDFEVFGNVQGVCFRMYTEDQAKKLGVSGWVKNTRQGTVVGQVQGPTDKVREISPAHCDLIPMPAEEDQPIPATTKLSIASVCMTDPLCTPACTARIFGPSNTDAQRHASIRLLTQGAAVGEVVYPGLNTATRVYTTFSWMASFHTLLTLHEGNLHELKCM
uniref:Acylphosphatase n=1 Tax=Scleropages formosus TaxID=113540 RepID=A0A8C9TNC9_SCLFO